MIGRLPDQAVGEFSWGGGLWGYASHFFDYGGSLSSSPRGRIWRVGQEFERIKNKNRKIDE